MKYDLPNLNNNRSHNYNKLMKMSFYQSKMRGCGGFSFFGIILDCFENIKKLHISLKKCFFLVKLQKIGNK